MVYGRITNSFMTSMFLRDVQQNLKDVTKLQHQISTGNKLDYPSDDPIGADRILDYQQTLDKITQYKRNIDDANSLATNTDSALDTLNTVMNRVRDLAVRGSNVAPFTQQQLDDIASEVNDLIHMFYTQANQKFNGKYIFAGYKTDTQPFEISNKLEFVANPAAATNVLSMPQSATGKTVQAITDANSVTDIEIYDAATNSWSSISGATITLTSDPVNNRVTATDSTNAAWTPFTSGDRVRVYFDKDVSVTYHGDMGEKSVEINDGTYVPTTYVGAASDNSQQQQLFGQYSASELDSQTTEAFQYLIDLRDNISKRNNLSDNGIDNVDDIGQGITDSDTIINNLLNVRSQQGGRVNRLDLAMNRHESAEIETKAGLSNYKDVDMTEALSELVLKQNIYQAALAAGSRIIQTTLLDYLG